MSLKSLYSLVLLLLLSASNSLSQTSASDETSIYTLVLNEVIADLKSRYTDASEIVPLLIASERIPANEISSQRGDDPRGQKGLNSNFVLANQRPTLLTQQFSRDQRFRLVSISTIDEMLIDGQKPHQRKEAEQENELRAWSLGLLPGCYDPWKLFYKNFPKARGYYQMSRVGFSDDRRFALVEVRGEGACWHSAYSLI